MKSIRRKRAENIAEVLANGPRLRYGQNTWIEAKTEDNKYLLLGGLGGMGIGTMWMRVTPEDLINPEYIDAPIRKISPFDLATMEHGMEYALKHVGVHMS